MRNGKRAAAVVAVAATIVTAVRVSAHRRDEYLQAVRIGIDSRSADIELDLTPGIAVADAVVADVDRDGDGTLSDGERAVYVGRVLDAVHVAVDRRPCRVEIRSATFPSADVLRRGEGTIALRGVVALPEQPAGVHHLAFHNSFETTKSAYVANALVPWSDRVKIAAQNRDPTQQNLTITYNLRGTGAWWAKMGGAVVSSAAFVLALLLLPRSSARWGAMASALRAAYAFQRARRL